MKMCDDRNMLTSASRNSDGQTSGFEVGSYGQGVVYVTVTSYPSGGSMSCVIESSYDNSSFDSIATFTVSSSGVTAYQLSNFGKYVRIHYSLGGDTWTFKIDLHVIE